MTDFCGQMSVADIQHALLVCTTLTTQTSESMVILKRTVLFKHELIISNA